MRRVRCGGTRFQQAGRGTGARRCADADLSVADGRDLQATHSVIGTVVYSLAPGLNLFGELRIERNGFRTGDDFETSALTVSTTLTF